MATPANQRLIARAAIAIHAALAEKPSQPRDLPVAAWERCCRLQFLLKRACEVGRFPLAENALQMRLEAEVERLAMVLQCPPWVNSHLPTRPSCHDIADELVALFDEFSSAEVNLRDRCLSVTADAVELEDVYLGRFRIHLFWEHISDAKTVYTIEALDPVPAASSDAYAHPHIDDEILCEGDGKAAIAKALADGRLCDFFVLIRQVLNTYNSGSTYVQMDDWFDSTCRDCGYSTASEKKGGKERGRSSLIELT